VLVCGKCQRKRDRPSFRDDLRRSLKTAGFSDRFRVVETTCMDICSKDGITIVRGREIGGVDPLVRIVGPDTDPDDVTRWLTG
jgi:hypothetical protein